MQTSIHHHLISLASHHTNLTPLTSDSLNLNTKSGSSTLSKCKFDLSFNRHGPSVDLTRRYACNIDPLAQSTSPEPLPVSPSIISSDPSPEEWSSHYRQWAFPIRTDPPRGLIWGPFREPHPLSSPLSPYPISNPPRLKRSHPFHPSLSSAPPKRRRLVVILAVPRQPLIVHLKIKSHSTLSSHPHELDSAHVGLIPRTGLENMVDLRLLPPPKSRITLCISSQLKYGS